MKFRFEPSLKFLTALAFASVAAPLCAGQRVTGPRSPRPDSTQRELQRTLERDLLFKEMRDSMARGPARRPSPPTRRPDLTQIGEDFTRIQVANNALARALAAGGELDFKFVAQSASEIKKRAGRLRDNLALPLTDELRPKERAGIEPSRLKAALNTLDGLVMSFVTNPGFQSVHVIDAQWAVKARQDLEGIIEMSGRVKACSEQLHKAAQKSR
jgi:hypothetical protein